jgi:hypothetical protein
VDIYDLPTNSWSTALLSEARRGPSAVAINNKIYFAGGEAGLNPPVNGLYFIPSDRIDIYDNATNSWSISSLKESKEYFAGIAAAGKIYWAGGTSGIPGGTYYPSCGVEIKDVNAGSTLTNLSRSGSWDADFGENAVLKDNKIVFPFNGDNKFDIYDITTNSWSIGVLPVNILYASIISVNNTIYIAGGYVNGVLSNQVWKLEF